MMKKNRVRIVELIYQEWYLMYGDDIDNEDYQEWLIECQEERNEKERIKTPDSNIKNVDL